MLQVTQALDQTHCWQGLVVIITPNNISPADHDTEKQPFKIVGGQLWLTSSEQVFFPRMKE